MRLSLFVVSLFVPLVFAMEAPLSVCEAAQDECDWEFLGEAGSTPTFDFTEYDTPFTPQVVHKNPKVTLGILNSNDVTQEFIMEDGVAEPIILFGTPAFTPEFFKPYAIPQVMGSAVGAQVPQGDQATEVRGRCVKVYFTDFQRLRPKKNPPQVVNVHVGFPNRKCVIFKTAV